MACLPIPPHGLDGANIMLSANNRLTDLFKIMPFIRHSAYFSTTQLGLLLSKRLKMKQISLVLLFGCFAQPSIGQTTEIVPFTGIIYQEKGVYIKDIVVELDEQTWTSNQLPTGSEFEIKLIEPKGFSIDKDHNYHPNIRLTIFDDKGDTVGHTDQFMGVDNVFDQFTMENLSLSLGFKPGTPTGHYTVKASFYDELFPSSIDLILELDLVETIQSKPVTDEVYSFISYKGYRAKTNGNELKEIKLGQTDSTTSRTMIEIPVNLNGYAVSKEELVNSGTFNVSYCYLNKNSDLRTIDIESMGKIEVTETASGASNIELVIAIPINLYRKNDFVRFRWDSKDGKALDFVLKLN